MERHFTNGSCKALNPTGIVHAGGDGGSMRVCEARTCKTKMVEPIRCGDCGREFCPLHRWRGDHACTAAPSQVSRVGGGGMVGKGKGKSRITPPVRKTEGGKSTAGVSSENRNRNENGHGNGNGINVAQVLEDSKKKVMTSLSIPGKVDKRAKAEQASARKGLEMRARKGLLTEEEKLRYATEKALEAKGGSSTEHNTKGCAIS